MFFSFRSGAVYSTLFLLLTACGGGGDGDAPKLLASGSGSSRGSGSGSGSGSSSGSKNTTSGLVITATTMSCKGSGNIHCSGDRILKTDNGIALTASGVQTYGISTTDLETPIKDRTKAEGLRPATGGLAEVRVKRDAAGEFESVALLLSNMGLSWDGKNERPPVIETFSTQQGRVQLDKNGLITFEPLPPTSNTDFYDFETKGSAGTQENYANNIYFPRADLVRCPKKPGCPSEESPPLMITQGNWKTGGSLPDTVVSYHLHSDGATQAGDVIPVSTNDQWIFYHELGIPYPGFKGYRNYVQWSYGYANVAGWITQDTVLINEWGGNNEHNKMRRGIVAFGDVTNPAQIPATGTATYVGGLRGWFSYDELQDSYPIYGDVEVKVDFAKKSVQIQFIGTRLDEVNFADIPLSMTTTTNIGTANLANYFTGSVSNGTVNGGIGARFFGPVTTSGGTTGPAEVAGSFTFQSPNKGPVAIGGFLLKKQ